MLESASPAGETRVNGKVCVITGGTDGIGKAAAHGLAMQGARLLVQGRDPDKGARAVAELKSRSGNSPRLSWRARRASTCSSTTRARST